MKLWPVIIQNQKSGEVLMLGYMNIEAYELTRSTGFVHFWSRSRNCIWKKGETSGNFLNLKREDWDCDKDTLLIQAEPSGPTCHQDVPSCFVRDEKSITNIGLLEQLTANVDRSLNGPSDSVSKSALSRGAPFWIRKVQEECTEVGLAVSYESKERIGEEIADLLYRLVLLIRGTEIKLSEIESILSKRNSTERSARSL